MENSNKPIYPIFNTHGFCTNELNIDKGDVSGLTKREYFAGLAMQGMLASNMSSYGREYLSTRSIEFADELLKQLENK